MGKHYKRHLRSHDASKAAIEIDAVEEIVTCDCSHRLRDHSAEGCAVEDCECVVERGLLLIGKIHAIDEL